MDNDGELMTLLSQAAEVIRGKLDSNTQQYIAQKAKADEVRKHYVAFENLRINQKASGAGMNPDTNEFQNTVMKEWNSLKAIEAARQDLLKTRSEIEGRYSSILRKRRLLNE